MLSSVLIRYPAVAIINITRPTNHISLSTLKIKEHAIFLKQNQSLAHGPYIKYVTLFLANFDPPSPFPPLSDSYIPGPPESTSHNSDLPIFSRPSTKIPDKSPLYKFYLNCSRRFLSGAPGGFVRVGFCPFSFCHNTSVTTES